jgi:hypothetical protein
MAGRFAGVSDLEWRLFEDVFPPAPTKRGRGMPHTPFRKVLNTLLYVLIAQFIAICSSAKTCEIGENLHFVSDPL